jgi:sulfoxide reductase heme-binding subunit YedZ
VSALDYPFWLASRAAGITAYVLLSLAVSGGLIMALRMPPRHLRALVRTLHERVAVLALGFVAVHGLLLLGDTWLKATLSQILIPFTNPYRPFWTGLGILAFYGAAGLGLTYYARARLGARRWRNAHRFIPIAWALAVLHVIGAGTDARSLWLLIPVALTVGAAGWLLADRWLAEPEDPPAPPPPPAPRRPEREPAPARLWASP